MKQLQQIFDKYRNDKRKMAKDAGVSLATVYSWYDKKTIPISVIESLGFSVKVEEK